jgi:TatD DNase family protein
MFVDSHCHLDCIELEHFENDFDKLIAQCTQSRIEHMLCVSIDLEKYPRMRKLVEHYPQISVSVGVHPMADESQPLDADRLDALAQDDKVVAIGETGLDYYYHKGDNLWQQDRFRQHVRCAVEHDKPVIIHTRDAGDDTLAILREENAQSCGGVIHCFTETQAFAEQAMELGFFISFSGIITFNNADALRQIAASIPEDRLLIETDSPYLAPVPHRGKQNWPSMVSHVADKLAEIRHTSAEHIAAISRDNFYRLFQPDRSASN